MKSRCLCLSIGKVGNSTHFLCQKTNVSYTRLSAIPSSFCDLIRAKRLAQSMFSNLIAKPIIALEKDKNSCWMRNYLSFIQLNVKHYSLSSLAVSLWPITQNQNPGFQVWQKKVCHKKLKDFQQCLTDFQHSSIMRFFKVSFAEGNRSPILSYFTFFNSRLLEKNMQRIFFYDPQLLRVQKHRCVTPLKQSRLSNKKRRGRFQTMRESWFFREDSRVTKLTILQYVKLVRP